MSEDKKNIDADYTKFEDKKLTKEEIENNYYEIKQIAQLMNNISTKTAVKYLERVSESNGIALGIISIPVNGGPKKYYLKEAVHSIVNILDNKAVIVKVPVHVKGDSETTFGKTIDSESEEESSSTGGVGVSRGFHRSSSGLVQEEKESDNQKLAVIKSLEGIAELKNNFKEFSGNLRELNDNVRNVNNTMQSTISKVIEQGIDLKERYLKDREERTLIERQQVENYAKQSEALLQLSKNIEQRKPTKDLTGLVIFISILIVLLILVGGGFWLKEYQKSLHQELDTRLDQERQIQTSEYEATIKQLKDSLTALTPTNQNAAGAQTTNTVK